MKELISEDLLNTLRLIKYDRSRTLMENNLLVEQSVWDIKEGDNKYWVTLYDRLKNNGVSVKYMTSDGKETKDPKTSTILRWGSWTIWKDTKKNGGYPIQLYSNSGSFTFKWKLGKYKGEELNDSLILCAQKKNIDYVLTDFLRLNNVDRVKKLINYGGCEGLREKTMGSIDMVKTAQLTEDYPYCFKQKSQKISKKDPLYKEKTSNKKINYKEVDKYGVDMIPLSQATDADLFNMYRSGNVNNLYDLIWAKDLGSKNKSLGNLKYSPETLNLGTQKINISEKNYKLEPGYRLYKDALAVRKQNTPLFGWPTDNMSIVMNYSNIDTINDIQPTVAIDPSYLEIQWVKEKGKVLSGDYNLKTLKKDLERSFENSERFRRGLSPLKQNEQPNFYKSKEAFLSNKGNAYSIGSDNEWLDYKKRHDDYIKKEVVNWSKDNEVGKTKVESQNKVDSLRLILDQIKLHNTNLYYQKKDWMEMSCGKPVYQELEREVSANDKAKLVGESAIECDTKSLYAQLNLKEICKTEQMGGLFVQRGDLKKRSSIVGVDWKTLKFKYQNEQKPDNVFCSCANPKSYREYDNIDVNANVGFKCWSKQKSEGERSSGAIKPYFKVLYKESVSVTPRKFLFQTADVRSSLTKFGDWTKSCFTGTNEEGEKDFHCLLDVASIAAVFIPVVGPIVSMIIDVANGMYYLVDAYNANTGLDRNGALISAGLTILGGIASGFGDARAFLKTMPRSGRVVGFADKLMIELEGKNLKNVSKKEASAVFEAIKKDLQRTYKLSIDELKAVDNYYNSLKLLKGPKYIDVVENYVSTVRKIRGKITDKRWQELMTNKNFVKFVKQSDGNVLEAIKNFNKTTIGKDFLIQIGFFAGGESVLPGLITPYFEEKIKSGKWGTLEQQIQINGYDFQDTCEKFGVSDKTFEKDLELLKRAWNDKTAILVDGKRVAWRPKYEVPTKYQTETYKKLKKERDYYDIVDPKKQTLLSVDTKEFKEKHKETIELLNQDDGSEEDYDPKIYSNVRNYLNSL